MRNPNARWIREHFETVQEERRGGRTITISNALDAGGRWLDQHLHIRGPEGVEAFRRRARLYTAGDLEALLAEAGFGNTVHYDGPGGGVFQDDASGRIVTVGRAEA